MRTAILHIGLPKTGSTAIQRYLLEHRQALLERGFAYPSAPGKRNHVSLAALGMREDYHGNAMRRAGAAADPAALGERLARDLAAELAALPEGVHSAVFSSEQLAVRIKDTAGLERLRDLLAPHFGGFRVIAYLRRQDEAAVSRYSTGLRSGGETSAAIFPAPDEEGGIYQLAEILERYAAVFGAAAVTPRIFDRAELLGGDVVTDFLRTIGIADLTPEADGARNPSLRADVQELIRRYNAQVEVRGVTDRPRLGPLLRDERYWGRGRMPARAEAEAFLARFADGNERIRATWFADRPTLFGTDFSRYPDAEDGAATADARVLEVALDVLIDLGAAMQEAEAERRMVLGREAQAAGRGAEARSHFSRVLRAVDGHRGATKALRELDVAEGLAPGADPARKARKKERSGRKAGAGKERKAGNAPDGEGHPTPPQDRKAERRAARKAARTAREAPKNAPHPA